MRFLFYLMLWLSAVSRLLAQGTVYFANSVRTPEGVPLVDAPVFLDFTTIRLRGSDYLVQLYAAPDGSPSNAVRPIGSPVTFQTGEMAGYWFPSVVEVPGIPPGGIARLEARAWGALYGASYEEARAHGGLIGQSSNLRLPLGGNGLPPTVMTGLDSFGIILVPEPSPVALGGLAAVVIVIARWLRRSFKM